MAEIAATIGIVKEGTEAASGMLDLYSKMIDMVIPWETFDEALQELRANEDQYSREAAVLVGKIQTLLLNSSDQYKSSQEEVNRWCKTAVPVLKQYMNLFEYTENSDVAEVQKTMLLDVLNKGATHMSNAIEKLEVSRKSFNTAYGELTTLKTQLELDSNESSSYFSTAVSKLRTEAFSGAAAGIIFGPLGLAISYAIAAGVVEGELVPQLKKALEETKQQFNELQELISEARDSIEEAKKRITLEIHALGNISAKINVTKLFATTWAKIPALQFDALKESTTKLIEMCEGYIRATRL